MYIYVSMGDRDEWTNEWHISIAANPKIMTKETTRADFILKLMLIESRAQMCVAYKYAIISIVPLNISQGEGMPLTWKKTVVEKQTIFLSLIGCQSQLYIFMQIFHGIHAVIYMYASYVYTSVAKGVAAPKTSTSKCIQSCLLFHPSNSIYYANFPAF